jgi:4-amino-4-deoxy-L-arabinose transferase-like glycosyltransferase
MRARADGPVTGRFHEWLEIAEAKAAAFLRAIANRPRAPVIVLSLLCCALYLPGIATLPVTDRDEALFAQSSKQMLETGEYVDIRFKEKPRYKKPIGTYWLQSAAVAAATRAGAALNDIWAYRIPSFLGALAAVLLTYWAGRAVMGRERALAAAAMFASCLMLAFESRIAKADAALMAAIALSQGALFRLYMAPKGTRTRGLAALFWLGLGAGILLKGPVAPALAFITSATVLLVDRRRAWLANLHLRWGPLLTLAVALPWLIAIGIASGGEFFRHSVGQDFVGKLQSGKEHHGSPPGFYILAFWWTFWPAALFATAGAGLAVWRGRQSRRLLFLMAWIVPYWIILEAIPTKLPHYALPLYPAIAMALVLALWDAGGEVAKPRSRLTAILWVTLAAVQVVLLLGMSWIAEAPKTGLLAVLYALFLAVAAATSLAAWRSCWNAALFGAILSGVLFYAAGFRVALPAIEPIWISQKAARAANALKGCGSAPAGFAGFTAPSLYFLTGTEALYAYPTTLGEELAAGEASVAFVAWKRRLEFQQAFTEKAWRAPRFLGCVDGIDLNGKGPTRLHIYARPETESLSGCAPSPIIACRDKADLRWRRVLNTKF